jgi:hypothetical protein
MDRRTFITTSTAAAVGLASNAISTTRAQGKQPRSTLTEGDLSGRKTNERIRRNQDALSVSKEGMSIIS